MIIIYFRVNTLRISNIKQGISNYEVKTLSMFDDLKSLLNILFFSPMRHALCSMPIDHANPYLMIHRPWA